MLCSKRHELGISSIILLRASKKLEPIIKSLKWLPMALRGKPSILYTALATAYEDFYDLASDYPSDIISYHFSPSLCCGLSGSFSVPWTLQACSHPWNFSIHYSCCLKLSHTATELILLCLLLASGQMPFPKKSLFQSYCFTQQHLPTLLFNLLMFFSTAFNTTCHLLRISLFDFCLSLPWEHKFCEGRDVHSPST